MTGLLRKRRETPLSFFVFVRRIRACARLSLLRACNAPRRAFLPRFSLPPSLPFACLFGQSFSDVRHGVLLACRTHVCRVPSTAALSPFGHPLTPCFRYAFSAFRRPPLPPARTVPSPPCERSRGGAWKRESGKDGVGTIFCQEAIMGKISFFFSLRAPVGKMREREVRRVDFSVSVANFPLRPICRNTHKTNV